MEWYYSADGERKGPVSDAQLVVMARSGTVDADTLVWRKGMEVWTKYGEIKGNRDIVSSEDIEKDLPVGQARCAVSRKVMATEDMELVDGVFVAPECVEAYEKKQVVLEEATPTTSDDDTVGGYPVAGFVPRFVAWLFDLVLISIPAKLLEIVTIGPYVEHLKDSKVEGSIHLLPPELAIEVFKANLFYWLGYGIIVIVYITIMLSRYSATAGKMLMGLRVLNEDGSPLTLKTSFFRSLGDLLSRVIFFIGFALALFDSHKRALHDFICETRVVQVRRPGARRRQRQ